jgi:hypothetical protein
MDVSTLKVMLRICCTLHQIFGGKLKMEVVEVQCIVVYGSDGCKMSAAIEVRFEFVLISFLFAFYFSLHFIFTIH